MSGNSLYDFVFTNSLHFTEFQTQVWESTSYRQRQHDPSIMAEIFYCRGEYLQQQPTCDETLNQNESWPSREPLQSLQANDAGAPKNGGHLALKRVWMVIVIELMQD
jgi:hypothetical protein